MSYDEYRKLLENVGTRTFLAKPYGLELLFILERCELENADNGVEDTHELLTQFKPRRGAFSTYIQDLCTDGYITKSTSRLKASKSILRMSTDVGTAFKALKIIKTTPHYASQSLRQPYSESATNHALLVGSLTLVSVVLLIW